MACTKAADENWPASLMVTATSGAAEDCSAIGTDTVGITVLTKPVVVVEGPETEDVCSNATEVSFIYTVSSGEAPAAALDLTVESTAPTAVTCAASSANPGKVGGCAAVSDRLWLLARNAGPF